jgi:hypothetical protein
MLTACASIHQYQRPGLAQGPASVTYLAVVPVDVEVRRNGEPEPTWTAAARANLVSSLVEHFGADGRLVVKPLAAELPANAEAELAAIRDQIRALSSAVDKQPPPPGCSPLPIPGLMEAANADALLLVYGFDRIRTAGQVALLAGVVVVLLPLVAVIAAVDVALTVFTFGLVPFPITLHVLTEPGLKPQGQEIADLNSVTLCLVDGRTAEVLWVHVQTVGTGRLTDLGDVDKIIETSYRDFRAAVAL